MDWIAPARTIIASLRTGTEYYPRNYSDFTSQTNDDLASEGHDGDRRKVTVNGISMLFRCCFLCWGLASAFPLHGQEPRQKTARAAAVELARSETMVDRSMAVKSPLGFSARTYNLDRAGVAGEIGTHANRSMPHGVIGAAIGGVAGGAIGYLRMRMFCEMHGRCDATRDMLIGAAIGATIGVVVEYVVRN